MTLKDLKKGESAVITTVGGQGALRQHFLDMGVIPGAEVTLIKYAPMGDPMELTIHGYELTLRLADAEKIDIEPVKNAKVSAENKDEAASDKGHNAGMNGKDTKTAKQEKAVKTVKLQKQIRSLENTVSIPDSVKKVYIMTTPRKIRYRKELSLPLL